MGKTVVGFDAWTRRGLYHQGKFEEMLLITDEVLIAWTLDGHYNGWCDLYKNRYRKRDGRPKGRQRESEEEEASPTETEGEESQNKMEKCKQLASSDENDWLNYQRPRCGSWFVKRSMDEGYTKRNGGTTELGKVRWNEWGAKIAMRRNARTNDNLDVKEKYIAFCQAFQIAWKEMYGNDKKQRSTGDDGSKVVKIAAFNGISFSV